MINIRISIPDRLLTKIENCDLEESELITVALDNYFKGSLNGNSELLWKKFIETKIVEVQQQLDDHRKTSTDDTMVELDNDLRQRIRGEKSPLDITSAESIRLTNPETTNYPPTPSGVKPKKKWGTPLAEEVSLDDLDLKL